MSWLAMVGLTHRSAPLALLERVAIHGQDRPELLAALRIVGCAEAVVLSTRDRVEIYLGNSSPWPDRLLEMLLEMFAEDSGVTLDELRAVVEVRTGQAVVEHLCLVTAGLQSRTLDKAETLAQTHLAFHEAKDAGMIGQVLGQSFPEALRSGHQVRSESCLAARARLPGVRCRR